MPLVPPSLGPTWPTPTSVCLACRTAVAGSTCTACGEAHAASLVTASGREALLVATWGPPERRARLRQALKVGGASGAASGFFDGCSGCEVVTELDVLAVVLAVAFLATIVWYLSKAVYDWWQRRKVRRELVPWGASTRPKAPSGRRLCGVAPPGQRQARDPITGEPCLAYAATLRHGADGPVVLRDGGTQGFSLELDTGDLVEVPPGGCAIEPSGAAPMRLVASQRVRAIDRSGARSDDLDPFEHDHVELELVRAGEPVELLSPVAEVDGPLGERLFRGGRRRLRATSPVYLRRSSGAATR